MPWSRGAKLNLDNNDIWLFYVRLNFYTVVLNRKHSYDLIKVSVSDFKVCIEQRVFKLQVFERHQDALRFIKYAQAAIRK